jgi:peptide/nickel transport system permease protein
MGHSGTILTFALKRLALALVTLWLLSVIVFLGGQLLPGDVGRAVLGPLADARAVAHFNHEIGADRPLLNQYWHWISHFAAGDMGTSFVFRSAVGPFVAQATANSLKLAALAFLITVPLGVAAGVFAALRQDRWIDKTIVVVGQTLGVVPEFISAIVLILVFGIGLHWLPMSADWPDGAGPLTQVKYLILPSLPLTVSFFGYIARVARAGTVDALNADYTRTAVLKGLPWRVVLFRHVLRNALPPVVTVSASLIGYLTGGLVVVETLFHYRGVGSLIFTAAKAKDFPMLEGGVLVVGLLFVLASIVADAIGLMLNPRLQMRAAE